MEEEDKKYGELSQGGTEGVSGAPGPSVLARVRHMSPAVKLRPPDSQGNAVPPARAFSTYLHWEAQPNLCPWGFLLVRSVFIFAITVKYTDSIIYLCMHIYVIRYLPIHTYA